MKRSVAQDWLKALISALERRACTDEARASEEPERERDSICLSTSLQMWGRWHAQGVDGMPRKAQGVDGMPSVCVTDAKAGLCHIRGTWGDGQDTVHAELHGGMRYIGGCIGCIEGQQAH